MDNRSMRFAKLMSAMGAQEPTIKPTANPGIDSPEQDPEKLRQAAIMDSKIQELEASDDPNALESLNFWKQQRSQLRLD